MGDRVAVLKDGFLQQVDTPAEPLRPADEPVRRRVHRLAVDEPVRGIVTVDAAAARSSVGNQTVGFGPEVAGAGSRLSATTATSG